ncbi:MAG: hypothetical protein IPO48_17950 [Saprospiraceae bacterium]|nr:hypothetical protein [Saprospiraceae bacterium]
MSWEVMDVLFDFTATSFGAQGYTLPIIKVYNNFGDDSRTDYFPCARIMVSLQ